MLNHGVNMTERDFNMLNNTVNLVIETVKNRSLSDCIRKSFLFLLIEKGEEKKSIRNKKMKFREERKKEKKRQRERVRQRYKKR